VNPSGVRVVVSILQEEEEEEVVVVVLPLPVLDGYGNHG
jgi:hypothetical protein